MLVMEGLMLPFPLIQIVVTLLVLGLILYLLQLLPIDAVILQWLRVIILICTLLWLVSVFIPIFR